MEGNLSLREQYTFCTFFKQSFHKDAKAFRFLHTSKAVCLLSPAVLHCVPNCGRWRNRTPTKGFGDLRSTTKLIARILKKQNAIITTKSIPTN